MRYQFLVLCGFFLLYQPTAGAESNTALDYGFQFTVERSALEGLSLGDEPGEDRLIEEDHELEIDLEYQLNDSLYLFFVGAFIDETETIETAKLVEEVSGFERKEIGLGYFFGDSVQSELNIGRMEFSSRGDWFLWWDEELDGIRLASTFSDFEFLFGLAEEQARESTTMDFIDPEQKSVNRTFFSMDWELIADHSLVFYYLDQSDDSKSFNIGEFEDFEKIDEEDADLSWSGISYFGEFDVDRIGLFEIELHTARISGDEIVYEFDDPSAGLSEVVERERNSVRGSAQSYLINWTPASLHDWSLVFGNARGSGDGNPDDNRLRSFRQTGLQDDAESFGKLYRPELSNLVVDVIGVRWQFVEGVEVSLLGYEYRQQKLAEEMRDVSIEFDPSGLSRDLGRETDLVVAIEAGNGLEFILTVAEFDPGEAYGGAVVETSNYINLEIAYEF